MKAALAETPKPAPFDIAIRGLGWFPNPRNPRVFWAGIESSTELTRLAKDTETAVAALGVPVEDRDYHPHLTLARRRDPVPVDRLRAIVDGLSSADFGSFRASSFFLYLSTAGKYTKLQEYPFVS
jgi:2'-5' RNA ligase